MPARSDAGEPVVGLEVHAQLLVPTKLLCACPADGEATCEVCLGHPGTLPVVSEEAVRVGLVACVAMNATPAEELAWTRKHYAYRDLPRGYQVTQDAPPLGRDGQIVLPDGRVVPVVRIHLEEDAGRTRVVDGAYVVDDGRAGMALVEVVTAPVLGSGADAEAAMRAIHGVLVAAGVCGGAMERGQLRCDANVSLRGADGAPGPRVELKNLNSFRYVRRAVDAEIQRQREAWAAGQDVEPHTRGWDGKTARPLRPRVPHRWLEETDLLGGPPRRPIPAEFVAHARAAWRARAEDASPAGGAEPGTARAVPRHTRPGGVAGGGRSPPPQDLQGRRRAVTADPFEEGPDPGAPLVRQRGRIDAGEVLTAVRAACGAHPREVARYRAGERAILDFLVGRVMAATQRRADPAQVHGALRCVLGEGTTEGEGP